MVFTVMAALAQMEIQIKRERNADSVAKRRAHGGDLGGRRQQFTDAQIRYAAHRVEQGEAAAAVARELGMSRATFYRRVGQLPPGNKLPVDRRPLPDLSKYDQLLAPKTPAVASGDW